MQLGVMRFSYIRSAKIKSRAFLETYPKKATLKSVEIMWCGREMRVEIGKFTCTK